MQTLGLRPHLKKPPETTVRQTLCPRLQSDTSERRTLTTQTKLLYYPNTLLKQRMAFITSIFRKSELLSSITWGHPTSNHIQIGKKGLERRGRN
jgi:hypothetical protein